MRLAFMGTPAFAVPALDALVQAGYGVSCVYSQPPRPGNRGRVEPSPVHARALELGIPVRTPVNFKAAEERDAFAALELDAAVVAAYGLILPAAILDAPRRGCFNIHASLLPRWRGAAPIQRAILAGDAETGVTIMRMERGLDTGPMLLSEPTTVDGKTAGELTVELAAMGARLMVDVLNRLDALPHVAQPEDGVTYAAKIDKAEARIDWNEPADAVLRRVRAMNPAPGAWCMAGDLRLKLHAGEPAEGSGRPGALLADGVVACGVGAVRLARVQPAGSRAMPWAEFARARAIASLA